MGRCIRLQKAEWKLFEWFGEGLAVDNYYSLGAARVVLQLLLIGLINVDSTKSCQGAKAKSSYTRGSRRAGRACIGPGMVGLAVEGEDVEDGRHKNGDLLAKEAATPFGP